MAPEETSVAIDHDVDIVAARRKARELAKQVGFSGSDLTIIATAISEVARNIVVYANRGEIILSTVQQGSRRGVLVVARDQGPGIPDIPLDDRFHETGLDEASIHGTEMMLVDSSFEKS